MKYSNDYEIVVEHKYYAVFRDGEGIERKIEIEKEVADALTKAQRAENNQSRYARKYTVSLDSLDMRVKPLPRMTIIRRIKSRRLMRK